MRPRWMTVPPEKLGGQPEPLGGVNSHHCTAERAGVLDAGRKIVCATHNEALRKTQFWMRASPTSILFVVPSCGAKLFVLDANASHCGLPPNGNSKLNVA